MKPGTGRPSWIMLLEYFFKCFQLPNCFRTNVFDHKVASLDHSNETIRCFFLQFFFCAKHWKHKFSLRNNASSFSRPYDQQRLLMISCCSRDNSRASTDNPGCSDVFVFSFSSAQNFENINSVCVIMPPSFPGRMISCSRDNSPASTDDPGYLGSSRIRKFPE